MRSAKAIIAPCRPVPPAALSRQPLRGAEQAAGAARARLAPRFPRPGPAKAPAQARGGGRRERPPGPALPLAARDRLQPADWRSRSPCRRRRSGLNSNRHRERPRRHRAAAGRAPRPAPSPAPSRHARIASVSKQVGTGATTAGTQLSRRRAGANYLNRIPEGPRPTVAANEQWPWSRPAAGAARGEEGLGRWARAGGRARAGPRGGRRRDAPKGRSRRRRGRREPAEGGHRRRLPARLARPGASPPAFPAKASLLPPRRSGGNGDADRRGGCRSLRLRSGGRMQQAGGEMGTGDKVMPRFPLVLLR